MVTKNLLTVSVERIGGHAVVRVVGEVDMGTAHLLDDELERAVAEGPAEAVVVDLSSVAFMSSAGLAALMRAHSRFTAANAELVVVVTPGSAPARAIAVTSLDRVFHLAEDLDQAMSADSGPGRMSGPA